MESRLQVVQIYFDTSTFDEIERDVKVWSSNTTRLYFARKIEYVTANLFCGFCPSRILHYFPLCGFVHRRDILYFSTVYRQMPYISSKDPMYNKNNSSWQSLHTRPDETKPDQITAQHNRPHHKENSVTFNPLHSSPP